MVNTKAGSIGSRTDRAHKMLGSARSYSAPIVRRLRRASWLSRPLAYPRHHAAPGVGRLAPRPQGHQGVRKIEDC